MTRNIAAVCMGLLLGAGSANAQVKASFNLGGGLMQPSSDFSDAAKAGWHLLGTAAIFPSGQVFGVQGTVFYAENKFETGSGKFKFVGGLAEIRLNLRLDAPFVPYVTLGGGVVNTKVSGGGSNTDGAFDGGLGVSYLGSSNFGFFFEARYLNVFATGSNLQMFPVTAGVRIAFR